MSFSSLSSSFLSSLSSFSFFLLILEKSKIDLFWKSEVELLFPNKLFELLLPNKLFELLFPNKLFELLFPNKLFELLFPNKLFGSDVGFDKSPNNPFLNPVSLFGFEPKIDFTGFVSSSDDSSLFDSDSFDFFSSSSSLSLFFPKRSDSFFWHFY